MSEIKTVPVSFPIELCSEICKSCGNEYAIFYVCRPDEEYLKEEPDAKPHLWMMEPSHLYCPFCGKPGEEHTPEE